MSTFEELLSCASPQVVAAFIAWQLKAEGMALLYRSALELADAAAVLSANRDRKRALRAWRTKGWTWRKPPTSTKTAYEAGLRSYRAHQLKQLCRLMDGTKNSDNAH